MADFRASSGAVFAWRRGTAPATPATVRRDNRWLLYAGTLGGARVWQAFGGTAGGSAAVLSAATGSATGGTTATVGCTTDAASGTLYWAVTTSATPLSAAAIKAGTGAVQFGSVAVSSTSPSASVTGLTSNTEYWTHVVQTVSAVDSNVATSAASWWTDNVGDGGGEVGPQAVGALAGAGAAVAGTARRTRVHATSGALAGGGAAVSGIAERVLDGLHVANGALAGGGAAVAGTAVRRALHLSTGALAGAGAAVAGVAVRRARHVATGALAGAGAVVAGIGSTPADSVIRSAPPLTHGPALGRRGRNLSTGMR